MRRGAALVGLLVASLPSAAASDGSAAKSDPLATCAALPIVEGQRGGGDYRNFGQPSGANASACRAACCADGACAFWGLDVKLPAPSRKSCTEGQACCWLKSAKVSSVNPPCAWGCYTGASGRAPPAPPPTPHPVPPPPFRCRTDEDCALSGTCNVAAGACTCYPGFSSPDCGALDIKPTDVSNGWKPKGFTTWGGSPIRVGKTFHLYAALNRWGTVDTVTTQPSPVPITTSLNSSQRCQCLFFGY